MSYLDQVTEQDFGMSTGDWREFAAELAADADQLIAENCKTIAAKDAGIARLREAMEGCMPALEIGLESARVISIFGDERPNAIRAAIAEARAALAQVAEVPK